MLTKWPKITIVTPALNSEKYLEETIKSILEQDYPNLEYIIIDGGSTDGTLDIIKKYEHNLAHWKSGPDKTMYDGIAKGFEKATGEILGWINSDDLLEAGCLQKVGGHFMKHPRHQVVYFENIVEKDGWWVPNRPHIDVGLGELLDCYVIYQDGVFFRREAYERIGGLNRSFLVAGDYDLWLRLSRRYRLHRCAGHVSCFRLVPGQLSMSNWGRYLEEIRRSRDALKERLTPLELKRAAWGKMFRKLPNYFSRKFRRRVWPIKNENHPWAPVTPPPPPSVLECRCPICNGYPHRLLFSSPDTAMGDRRLWRLYECRECNAGFIFPRPDNSTLQELYENSYSSDIEGVCPAPEGYYSPYRGRSLFPYRIIRVLQRAFPFLHKRLGMLHDDFVPIDERPEAAVLVVGCLEGRILEHFGNLGYKNLWGIEPNRKAAEVARSRGFEVNTGDAALSGWPHRPVDAIILNHALGRSSDPVGFLTSIKRLLAPNGGIYLCSPNFDSAFIDFYGPAWAHWHVPYNLFTASPGAVRKIAGKADLKVRWMKSSTPVHYAYMSERLSSVGIGGHISNFIDTEEPGFRGKWERAKGVKVLSWLLFDRLLRGDCLYAKMVMEDDPN
jgi:glycosyltransferase involved in cell wall biosynthesis